MRGLVASTSVALLAITSTVNAQTSEAALCQQLAASPTSATEAARSAARNTIKEKAGSPEAAFLNGCLMMGDGKADKAADFFDIAANKSQRSLYFDWLGRAYGDQAQKASKLRQPFLARKTKIAFEKAVALDADNIDARLYLTQFYQMAPGVMGGSEEKAREQVAAIRARNAYRGGMAAGSYATRAKDHAGAEREYDALVKAYPDSLGAWNSLIAAQVAAQKWNNAFRSAESMGARTNRPSLGDYAIGRIAALSGEQLERGEAALRKYLTTTPAANEPTLASAHFRLAQILQAKKDIAAARLEYQETLRLQPTHADAKKALASLK